MTKKNLAIILPAFNEEITIKETINIFSKEFPFASIWVINNNSTDNTEPLARAAFKKIGCKGGVINEKEQGKGCAIRRAFSNVQADYYLVCDADLTYPISYAHHLLEPLFQDKADMVVGDRHSLGDYSNKNKRNFHIFGNWLVCKLVNILFHSNLVDVMSGYRALNKKFVKNYPILVSGFEIETDMTLHALDKRFRIVEIPIKYKERPESSFSKLNTLSDGTKVLFTIARILRYYKPLVFFGFLAFFIALLGFLAALPVILEWIEFQYIKHIPLAILATGLEVVAFILIAIGLILDSIAHHEKVSFERNFIQHCGD
jgi:glycosyltransferase involved in cell wall biosynthesis